MDPAQVQHAKPAKQSLQSRFGKILHITTRRNSASGQLHHLSRKNSASSTCSVGSADGEGTPRTIRNVANFSDLYDLGKEVMPSTHSYMKVHFATRKKDATEVVIKVRYKPNCFRSREDERSWRHNTEFLLNMPDNSGIARLYEVLEDKRAFYVVMEKVGGMDLFEALEHEGKVSVQVAKDIIRQLLSSLVHLHSHNAVHKDLKLENVMLDLSPKDLKSPASVKVIDFDTLEEWTPNSPTAKDVVGTDQYIAQEAYAGKYSPLSDIFAVGVIAYRLLCGKFPFHDEMFDDEAGENWVGSPKMAQIRRRLKVAKVDFSHPVFRDCPQACDLIMRMLAYNDIQRPSASSALEHTWFQEDEAVTSGAADAAVGGRDVRWDEDLIDDGIIVAQEATVGDDRRQALLRT
mmetsp:Transcript_9243/g.25906  ORF Transcript_9243/g.25906 Transcript_9243/m.25906 type:complete len:404 (-) Transcript_9243:140-1351(-)